MTAPTRRDVAADLRLSIGALIQSCTHLGDAILGAQTLGLADAELRGHFAVLRRRADELAAIADSVDGGADACGCGDAEYCDVCHPVKRPAPKLELIPGGIQSAGMCRECGRIGDHQPRCPEVA